MTRTLPFFLAFLSTLALTSGAPAPPPPANIDVLYKGEQTPVNTKMGDCVPYKSASGNTPAFGKTTTLAECFWYTDATCQGKKMQDKPFLIYKTPISKPNGKEINPPTNITPTAFMCTKVEFPYRK